MLGWGLFRHECQFLCSRSWGCLPVSLTLFDSWDVKVKVLLSLLFCKDIINLNIINVKNVKIY